MPRALLGDGTPVALRSKPPDSYGVVRVPQHLVRFDDDGSRAVELDEVTSSLLYLEQVGRGVRNNLLPFQPLASMAAHADGVYAGNGERYEIRDFDSAGTLRRIIRVLQPNRRVTPELAAAVIDEALANVAESRRVEARRALETAPRLDEVPAFVELIVDGEGHLWARQWALASEPVEWHVFHPDGNLLGTVRTPAGLRVLEIGADYVLGVARDGLDVEQVLVYGLSRAG